MFLTSELEVRILGAQQHQRQCARSEHAASAKLAPRSRRGVLSMKASQCDKPAENTYLL
jgi:hypothetical protein